MEGPKRLQRPNLNESTEESHAHLPTCHTTEARRQKLEVAGQTTRSCLFFAFQVPDRSVHITPGRIGDPKLACRPRAQLERLQRAARAACALALVVQLAGKEYCEESKRPWLKIKELGKFTQVLVFGSI